MPPEAAAQYLFDNQDNILIDMYQDTWQMRDQYRQQVKAAKARKAEQETTGKRQKTSQEAASSSTHRHEPAEVQITPVQRHGARADMTTMTNAMERVVQDNMPQALAHALRRILPDSRPDPDLAALGLRLLTDIGAPGGGPRFSTMSISTEKLKTLREQIKRSEDAIASSMYTAVESAKRLRCELTVLSQARGDIDDLLQQQENLEKDLD